MMMDRFAGLGPSMCTLVALGLVVAGCGDCSEEMDAAEAFLSDRENLVCTTNADCVVVSTGCYTARRGLCEQAQLSRDAAATSRWKRIQSDLESCEDSCDRCGAALAANCTDGFCGGSP
jgi:hypothetical protein